MLTARGQPAPGRLLLAGVALCLAVPGSAGAVLDPELKTPYRLQVVLHVAENRLLTPIFQEQVARELRDHLQLTYGSLARVEVVRAHKLLKDVRARGLQALDGWDELSPLKTHFVLIDHADGQYRIRARQHDGLTGLASPVVRRGQTGERRLVARAAARLVDRDFGLSGTVIDVKGAQVEVALKGGGLGVPLARWVKRGDVFAVARLTEEAGKRRAARVEWALLQVTDEPQAGVCSCTLYHRYAEESLRTEAGVLGYRCLKLTTLRGPLRLRLVDDKGEAFLNGVRVRVGRTADDNQPWERTTGLDGLIVTPDSYSNVAFVGVYSGGAARAKFPVEIVDDRVVVCPVEVSAAAVTVGQLNLRRDRWVRRTEENWNVAVSRFADLNDALKRSPEAALDLAGQALKNLSGEMTSLAQEGNELRQGAGKLDLSEGEQHLRELQKARSRLEQYIGELKGVIEQANSAETKALQTMLVRARVLEGQAEFEQAIKLYETVLSKRQDLQQVKSHLSKLQDSWRPKDAAHTRAREFIYNTWPRLEPADLKLQLDQAFKALAVCRTHGDRLTPLRLRQVNERHAAKLSKRLEVLRWARDSEDNRAETKALLAVAGRLRQLQAEVSALLSAGKAREQ